MARSLRIASGLTLLLLLGCSWARSPKGEGDTKQRDTLRLGIVGDQTYAEDLDAAYAALARGVDELARYHREVAALDAVVHVGDLVESGEEPEEVARRFAAAAALLDRLPVVWYPVAGDHDVDPPGYRPGSDDRSRRELFLRLVGERVPAAVPRGAPTGLLAYSVDLGGFRLIVLDSQEIAHAEPRWGDVFLARIGEEQLAWLEAELARDARPAVVALHQPQWLAWSGWQRVHELLRRHPVRAVVSGHLHHPQDGGALDGVRYLTVGATGGAVRQGSRAAGGVHHVSVVEVGGDGTVDMTLLPLDGGGPLALPDRRTMERAQALDVMLGGLWDLPARTPLFATADGMLVADCRTREPARLVLAGLGNPIDQDVTVTVALPETVELEGAGFAAGFCREEEAAAVETCTLPPPSPNLLYANPSGVAFAPEPPLWRSTLSLAAGAAPTTLPLTVAVAWPTPGSPLHLERRVALPIAACPQAIGRYGPASVPSSVPPSAGGAASSGSIQPKAPSAWFTRAGPCPWTGG